MALEQKLWDKDCTSLVVVRPEHGRKLQDDIISMPSGEKSKVDRLFDSVLEGMKESQPALHNFINRVQQLHECPDAIAPTIGAYALLLKAASTLEGGQYKLPQVASHVIDSISALLDNIDELEKASVKLCKINPVINAYLYKCMGGVAKNNFRTAIYVALAVYWSLEKAAELGQ